MLKNYFLLEKIVRNLNKSLSQAKIIQSFTEIKNEVVIESDKGSLHIGMNRNIPYLIFKRDHKRRSQSKTLLTDLDGSSIQSIQIINNKRVIEINLNEGRLVLNLYYSDPGMIVIQNDQVTEQFKNNCKELDYKEELHDKHFYRLLEQEIEFRNSSRDEMLDEIKASKQLFFYCLEKQDLLSVIELKHLNQEALTQESELIDAYRFFVYKMLNRSRYESLHKLIESKILQQIKNQDSTIRKLDALKFDQNEKTKYENFGHIIMANLHQIKKGLEKLETTDLFSDSAETISIPMKSNLTANENAERYYRKARSFEQNKKEIETRLKESHKKRTHFQSLLETVSESKQLKQLEKIRKQLILDGLLKSDEIKDKKLMHNPINEAIHFEIDSHDVYVGKNAQNNDFLSLKFSKANDYWFHVQGSPSSHVILKWHGQKQDPPKDLIKKVAALTAHYSKQKNASNVPVIYTLSKYVRKPKGAKTGSVTVSKEKSVFVQPKAYEELV